MNQLQASHQSQATAGKAITNQLLISDAQAPIAATGADKRRPPNTKSDILWVK